VSSGEPQPFPQNSAQVFGTGARITSSASGSCYPSTSTGYNLIRTPVSTAFVVRTASIPRALGSSRTAADGWSQTPHRSSAFLGAVRSQSGPSRVTGFKKQPRTLLVDTTSTCLGFQWTAVNKKQTHTHTERESEGKRTSNRIPWNSRIEALLSRASKRGSCCGGSRHTTGTFALVSFHNSYLQFILSNGKHALANKQLYRSV